MDSAKLFSAADLVVAPHGAASLFTMFMKRHGAYLEVHWGKKMAGEGNDWNPCHFSIASSTGSKVVGECHAWPPHLSPLPPCWGGGEGLFFSPNVLAQVFMHVDRNADGNSSLHLPLNVATHLMDRMEEHIVRVPLPLFFSSFFSVPVTMNVLLCNIYPL